MKPMIDVYIPAIDIDFVTEMKHMPMYIFVMLAAVRYQGEVLISLASSVKSFTDMTESEKSLHFPDMELQRLIKLF